MPPLDFCPYKGLQPYTEADRAYFFGRQRDSEIITSNLYAAPLTVLYGQSGVGKSSVLMAGVLPQLRSTPRLAVLVFRTWQDASFLPDLKKQLLDAASASVGKSLGIDPALALDDFLLELARTLHGSVFCIFDQFEEYFLYHEPTTGEEGFDAEFARAVNRREVAANFLLCLREDSLSKLDRFKGRIPNLLSNMLRLAHLDPEAAASAIRDPLEEYNRRLTPGQSPMTVEAGLVEAVIAQVRTGQVTLGGGAAAQAESFGAAQIETPYLQLVMTRLWEEERAAHSDTLRLATLTRLGGAQQIVRTHLDETMAGLGGAEKLAAARAFRFLVTPSGTKIAYSASDLSNYAGVPVAQLTPVLRELSNPEIRVLRAVAPPGVAGQEPRYEIFHDVLAPAILDWRERYLREERARQVRRAFLALGVAGLLIIAVLIVVSLSSTQAARNAQTVAELAQAQVTLAQKTGEAVGARATQVARERATREHMDAIVQGQTATASALQVVQADQTQEARAQSAMQDAQTQAANAAALSLVVLKTPAGRTPPFFPGPTTTPGINTEATAIAVATSAAQVLEFAVTSAQVRVSPRLGTDCPTTFTFTAVVEANQPGTASYRWERSDGSFTPALNLTFPGAGRQIVTDTWSVSAATSGWEQLVILAPEPLTSNQAAFSLQPIAIPPRLQTALAKNGGAGAQLGCPVAAAQTIETAQQVYQNGLMIWRKDTQVIYVLYGNGQWAKYDDTWDSSQRAGGYYTPPSGLIEPVRGFGKVWREQLGGPNSAIGWATGPEVSVTVQVQLFDDGFAFIDEDGDVKLFFPAGKWIGL